MRAYELMVIVDGTADDAGVEAAVNRIGEQVTAKRGEIKTTERWGTYQFCKAHGLPMRLFKDAMIAVPN